MRPIWLLLVLVPGSRLVAHGQGEVELTRVPSPIRLDGDMSDPAWADIAPLALTMYSPTAGGAPTQPTEIRVVYDDQYLYAGGWFFDSQPKKISSTRTVSAGRSPRTSPVQLPSPATQSDPYLHPLVTSCDWFRWSFFP